MSPERNKKKAAKGKKKVAKKAPVTRRKKKLTKGQSGLPADYVTMLSSLKERIRTAQVKAALSVTRELIDLYWDIGKTIIDRQREEAWGKSVVERLAKDIQAEFKGIRGFSPQNIWYMRAFHLAWTVESKILQQPVGELTPEDLQQLVGGLPWGHNIQLVTQIKDPVQRLWYARKTIENGWSRAVLVHQIESGLFERQGKAITNFQATLPAPQSDLAVQILKDPYNFDFLGMGEDVKEMELEKALLAHLQSFLLELGMGFAFVGRQFHLEVDGEDFYIDLLFYHLRLRCYVVIDLKVVPFKPEFAGKMSFYLSAVDDHLRQAEDQPSIGMILCKDKKRVIAEYSLRDSTKPIGVSEYHLTKSLPKPLKGSLPTIKAIEDRFNTIIRTNRQTDPRCPVCGGKLKELEREHLMDELEEDATDGQMSIWMAEMESGEHWDYSYDEVIYWCKNCKRELTFEEE